MCSQTFVSLYTYLKPEILFEFDVRFYTKELNWSPICHVYSYKTRIGGRFFSSTASDLLDFRTNKTEQYLQTKVFVPWWNITCRLQFRRNSNSQNFITFRSLWQNPNKGVARVGKLWSSETLLYPNISSWFFTILCKSYRSSTYIKFRVE